jgi:HEAT repeat protein
MTEYALRVALQLLGGYTLVIVALFLAALIRGWRWKRASKRSTRLRPQIQAALIDYAAGSDDLTRLRELTAESRADVAKGILDLQAAISGAARDRVCGLTLDLALVHNWREQIRSRDPVKRREAYSALAMLCASEPVRRVAGETVEKALDDPDHDVRLYAAQSIGQFGDPEQVERVFHFALDENLLGRALLAGPMRSHALDLCQKAIPEALASGDRERILSMLELAVAWERAIPLLGLHRLIDAGERDIRIQALRTAPLAIPEAEDENAILRALTDPDTEIAMAAAAAAGRRRLESALPSLARCLRNGNTALARTAAGALLALPPKGVATLIELSTSADEITANAALEALGRVPTPAKEAVR